MADAEVRAMAEQEKPAETAPEAAQQKARGKPGEKAPGKPREVGGPSGPEPTRYGDWERKGRVSDF